MATGKTKGGSTGLLMLPSSGQECVFDSFVRFSRSLKGDLKQHEATDNQKGASGCHSNSHTQPTCDFFDLSLEARRTSQGSRGTFSRPKPTASSSSSSLVTVLRISVI